MSLKKLKVLKLFHQETPIPERLLHSLAKDTNAANLQRIHEYANNASTLVNNLIQNGIMLNHLELGLSKFGDETAASIAENVNN